MTNMTQQINETSQIPLGAKLQSAREAMRLDRKDAAAQLRLNESIIDMIENNSFPASMPSIFVRGYTRSYGKLLQVSDDIIQAGLEPIKPKQATQEAQLTMPVTQMQQPLNSRNYLMKGMTVAVVITMVSLVAVWWNGHGTKTSSSDNIAMNLPAETPETAITAPAGASIQEAFAEPAAPVAPQAPAQLTASAAPLSPKASPSTATSIGSMTTYSAINNSAQAPTNISNNQPTITTAAAKPAPVASIPAYKRAAMAAHPADNATAEPNNSNDE
jgi:cytoskeleton protein RodZ